MATMDEGVDIFKSDEVVDRAETGKARQGELLPKGWYMPSVVELRPKVEDADGKNPGRRDVDVNFTFQKEDGTLAFVTMYMSPEKNNQGEADYRFNVWSRVEKVYTEAKMIGADEKITIRDVLDFLAEGTYQVYVIRTKDDSNMVNKIRVARG